MKDMTTNEEFQKWQSQWDLAAEQFAKEATDKLAANVNQKPAKTSYFAPNTPFDSGASDKEPERETSWQDIYYKSMDLSGLIVDHAVDKGELAPNIGPTIYPPTKHNPTHFASVGPDASPAPTEPMRVTRNWSDSPELLELNDLKKRIEMMERKHHDAEIKGKKGMWDELQDLRVKIEALSEKINREPIVDVT